MHEGNRDPRNWLREVAYAIPAEPLYQLRALTAVTWKIYPTIKFYLPFLPLITKQSEQCDQAGGRRKWDNHWQMSNGAVSKWNAEGELLRSYNHKIS